MTRDNLIVPILEGEEADNVVTPGNIIKQDRGYSDPKACNAMVKKL